MSKAELRKKMVAILARLNGSDRQRQSGELLTRLLDHPEYKKAERISVYLSTDKEIDTLAILQRALEIDGKQCFIPFVRRRSSQVGANETRMVMVKLNSIKSYHELELNHYGIKEPQNGDSWPRASPIDNPLDLILVPGVAFSADGKRLGHGKGYYDEFLFDWTRRAGKRPYTIGLALSEQVMDDVRASSDCDYQLDEILYERPAGQEASRR